MERSVKKTIVCVTSTFLALTAKSDHPFALEMSLSERSEGLQASEKILTTCKFKLVCWSIRNKNAAAFSLNVHQRL